MTDSLDENSERRLREILLAEAESVQPSPDALERIRARTGDSPLAWLSTLAWLRPVGAVAAAVMIAATLVLSATPIRQQILPAGDDATQDAAVHPEVSTSPEEEDEDDVARPSPRPSQERPDSEEPDTSQEGHVAQGESPEADGSVSTSCATPTAPRDEDDKATTTSQDDDCRPTSDGDNGGGGSSGGETTATPPDDEDPGDNGGEDPPDLPDSSAPYRGESPD